MDVIAIEGLRVSGKHGADPGEREREQPFDVDLFAEIDLDAASRSDDLSDTLNYARVYERVVQVVQSTSFALLERLAREILDDAVFVDARVMRARVRIAKPGLLGGATPSVTIGRENPGYRAS